MAITSSGESSTLKRLLHYVGESAGSAAFPQHVVLSATNIAYCLVWIIFRRVLISLRLAAQHNLIASICREGQWFDLSFPRLECEPQHALPLLRGERNNLIY
jgi:hypothetical protein